MTAPTLFDGLARSTDPDTSRAAAKAQRGGVEAAVLAEHQRARRAGLPGLSDDDLCSRLHQFHGPTVVTARSRLFKRGVLRDTGQRRESQRGHQQILWTTA